MTHKVTDRLNQGQISEVFPMSGLFKTCFLLSLFAFAGFYLRAETESGQTKAESKSFPQSENPDRP
jgi:hypothetical protein